MRRPIPSLPVEQMAVLFKMKKFVLAGMPQDILTESLYQWFRCMYGHIAHYDRFGFAGAWFSNNHDRSLFLARAVEESNLRREWESTYSQKQLEQEFADWVVRENLIAKYVELANADLEREERKELARLKSKYESGDQKTRLGV